MSVMVCIAELADSWKFMHSGGNQDFSVWRDAAVVLCGGGHEGWWGGV